MFEYLPIAPATQLVYLSIGVGLTMWVARVLRDNGRVFLARGCKGHTELAESLSHMLSVGFYLLHVGFVLLAWNLANGEVHDLTGALELLSTKVGLILVVLAASHFVYLALYARIHGKPQPLKPVPSPGNVEVIEAR